MRALNSRPSGLETWEMGGERAVSWLLKLNCLNWKLNSRPAENLFPNSVVGKIVFKMFLKEYNFCHYCSQQEEPLMVCEPCGLVKYCNEQCQYNDNYRHVELCLTIKNHLKNWLFYEAMSQEYKEEHQYQGLRALKELVLICHRQMTLTGSRQAGERTLEFTEDLRIEHENLCRKHGISGFNGFYLIFDTYLNLGKNCPLN